MYSINTLQHLWNVTQLESRTYTVFESNSQCEGLSLPSFLRIHLKTPKLVLEVSLMSAVNREWRHCFGGFIFQCLEGMQMQQIDWITLVICFRQVGFSSLCPSLVFRLSSLLTLMNTLLCDSSFVESQPFTCILLVCIPMCSQYKTMLIQMRPHKNHSNWPMHAHAAHPKNEALSMDLQSPTLYRVLPSFLHSHSKLKLSTSPLNAWT